MKKMYFNIVFSFSLIFSGSAKANYWLTIGTYSQGPGGRPEICGITSHSLHPIPMRDLDNLIRKGGKLLMKYTNLFVNLIVNGPVCLQVIRIKVTF